MTMTSSTIRVSETESEARKDAGKPAHWVDDAGTSFKNPWASWREHDWRDQLYVGSSLVEFDSVADDAMSTDSVWAL
jgi:hypothetical protein